MADINHPAGSLWVAVEPAVGWTLIGLTGELVYSTAAELQERLDGLFSIGQTRIAMDLSTLEFCDSAGIDCIVGAWRRARGAGGDLLVIHPGEQVRRMLMITGPVRWVASDDTSPIPKASDGEDTDPLISVLDRLEPLAPGGSVEPGPPIGTADVTGAHAGGLKGVTG